jgi:hypothetical protein
MDTDMFATTTPVVREINEAELASMTSNEPLVAGPQDFAVCLQTEYVD